jgi:cytochrome c2
VNAKQLFTSGNPSTGATACATCHTLADAGAQGQVGPDLDKVLKGKDAAFIKESILDPNKVDRAGLSAQHHAPELRRYAVGRAGGCPGQVPLHGDEQVRSCR